MFWDYSHIKNDFLKLLIKAALELLVKKGKILLNK